MEPSRLHLDNQYIAYQHALCLQQESRGTSRNTSGITWPPVFDTALALTQDQNPPRDLAHVRARSARTPPQIAYSLRSTGEESLDIVPSIDREDSASIGSINPPNAISEVFPGALYRHNGQTYQAKDWRRKQGKPYVRIIPTSAPAATSTRPMLRKVAIANPRSASHCAGSPDPISGGYAHVTITLWTSVEGFVTRTGGHSEVTDYQDSPAHDPLSRKTVSMPTSALLLYINTPWMRPDQDGNPTNRNEIANLLAHELSYRHSVALPNLGSITSNILTTTPDGDPYLLENSLAVYDNIHGGLGLTMPLARDIDEIIPKVAAGPSSNAQISHLLKRWLETATEPFGFPTDPGPSPGGAPSPTAHPCSSPTPRAAPCSRDASSPTHGRAAPSPPSKCRTARQPTCPWPNSKSNIPPRTGSYGSPKPTPTARFPSNEPAAQRPEFPVSRPVSPSQPPQNNTKGHRSPGRFTPMKGLLIAFEGNEGSGKTIQSDRLLAHLNSTGRASIKVHEPGSTPLGDHLRTYLKEKHPIHTISELLLFAAARAELTRRTIVPALDSGVHVFADRYKASSVAYQGFARGIDLEIVHRFFGPGERIVLLTPDAGALFVWQRLTEPGQPARPRTCCSVFWRERGNWPASEMILTAERGAWTGWSGERLYTCRAPWKVRSSSPGCRLRVANWRKCRTTVGGGAHRG